MNPNLIDSVAKYAETSARQLGPLGLEDRIKTFAADASLRQATSQEEAGKLIEVRLAELIVIHATYYFNIEGLANANSKTEKTQIPHDGSAFGNQNRNLHTDHPGHHRLTEACSVPALLLQLQALQQWASAACERN